jgi:hypothetical protein
MIVYRDIITGDEMLSDAFPLKEVVDAEGNKVQWLQKCLVNRSSRCDHLGSF